MSEQIIGRHILNNHLHTCIYIYIMCSYIVMLWCIDPQGRVHNYSTIASQVPYTCMGKTKLNPYMY